MKDVVYYELHVVEGVDATRQHLRTTLSCGDLLCLTEERGNLKDPCSVLVNRAQPPPGNEQVGYVGREHSRLVRCTLAFARRNSFKVKVVVNSVEENRINVTLVLFVACSLSESQREAAFTFARSTNEEHQSQSSEGVVCLHPYVRQDPSSDDESGEY